MQRIDEFSHNDVETVYLAADHACAVAHVRHPQVGFSHDFEVVAPPMDSDPNISRDQQSQIGIWNPRNPICRRSHDIRG